jgi:hypothetical protein
MQSHRERVKPLSWSNNQLAIRRWDSRQGQLLPVGARTRLGLSRSRFISSGTLSSTAFGAIERTGAIIEPALRTARPEARGSWVTLSGRGTRVGRNKVQESRL